VLVEPDPGAVANGIERALDTDWDHQQIRTAAERYGLDVFDDGLRRAIERD